MQKIGEEVRQSPHRMKVKGVLAEAVLARKLFDCFMFMEFND